MASTVSGWPYVTPTDKPLEYPAVSQNLANKLEAAIPAQWAAWTPTFTSMTVESASCFYQIAPSGLVSLTCSISVATMGSVPQISLPPGVTVAVAQPINFHMIDTSAGVMFPGIGRIDLPNAIILMCDPTTAGAAARYLGPAAPFNWAAGDILMIAGSLKKA